MRITSKGQVTIPQDVRESAGFLPGTEVDFVFEGATVTVRRAEPRSPTKGELAVARFAKTGSKKWTSEELLALLRPEHR